ncbi:DUF1381 domain-containing protein [Staphylococcus caprae]|uniref:DUF1381 domain-containing protein n=1 Tax=Staphylococcus caprae TaxID=29380 RepID=UPI0030C5EF08
MTQYLIRQFEDSTGHIHTNVEKARINETLSIVEAESREQALKIHKVLKIREAATVIFRNVKNFVQRLNKE